jgi:DUF1365 family protein
MHRRWRPIRNAFCYKASYFLFDVDELSALDRQVRGFGHNRSRPVSLHDCDYGRPPVFGLKASIEQYLANQGHDRRPERIELLTQARTVGYVFNPVSYFYCYGPDGTLDCIVAEVNNTFGDRIRYLLSDPKRVDGRFDRCYRQPKEMHVSPFMPMDLEYLWQFDRAGDRLTVQMDEFDRGERFFESRLSGTLRPLTSAALWATVLRFPLMPLKIIALIHWQALKLYFKRAPFFSRPPFVENWVLARDRDVRNESDRTKDRFQIA